MESRLILYRLIKKIVDEVNIKLESLGAPKGSLIEIEGKEEIILFGKREGLAIYFYGHSFDKMKREILEFVDTYPLCKGTRIVKIS
ncbi:hypothetical protein [Terrisporobacter vanillatitrophus]|uniref:hypothetical protein n=1 Tax=Terrisporobacter vanillatitrophus TaxID=3058402 RepID=UPI003366EAE0